MTRMIKEFRLKMDGIKFRIIKIKEEKKKKRNFCESLATERKIPIF